MPRAVLPENIPALPDTEAEALARIRDLLTRGWVEEARAFIHDVAARWPESPQVQHYVKVLAPPRVIAVGGKPSRPMDQENAWVREHAHEYPGCWMAVYSNRLIAADPDLKTVLAATRAAIGDEGALMHREPEKGGR